MLNYLLAASLVVIVASLFVHIRFRKGPGGTTLDLKIGLHARARRDDNRKRDADDDNA